MEQNIYNMYFFDGHQTIIFGPIDLTSDVADKLMEVFKDSGFYLKKAGQRSENGNAQFKLDDVMNGLNDFKEGRDKDS